MTQAAQVCQTPGNWILPATTEAREPEAVITSLVKRRIVLLGETHDNIDHHFWQAQMLAALHGKHSNIVIAFEMFPRRTQPALDRWISGELTDEAFLKAVQWSQVWGYDADLYMPLFQFARLNQLPMIAANVERSLVRRVGDEGWDAVPEAEREGVGRPAPADPAYERSLARVYKEKMETGVAGTAAGVKPDAPLEDVLALPDFRRFVAAQLTWDRAMAEAIADAAKAHPEAQIIGIMGRGHVEFGHGVPHQLHDLGVEDVAVVLPVSPAACADLQSDIADVVFVIDDRPGPPDRPAARKPRLGVFIETSGDGVRVLRVVSESVAEKAGIAKSDIITAAAGVPVRKVDELIRIVGRQAPGTWLPLRLVRGEETLEIVAKFPSNFAKNK